MHFKPVTAYVSVRVRVRNIRLGLALELRVRVNVSVISGELNVFLISRHLVAACGRAYTWLAVRAVSNKQSHTF